jgi:hypothetical protein
MFPLIGPFNYFLTASGWRRHALIYAYICDAHHQFETVCATLAVQLHHSSIFSTPYVHHTSMYTLHSSYFFAKRGDMSKEVTRAHFELYMASSSSICLLFQYSPLVVLPVSPLVHFKIFPCQWYVGCYHVLVRLGKHHVGTTSRPRSVLLVIN